MAGVLSMFSGKKKSKASLQLNHLSFRKSSESARGPKQGVDSTEARRKAAVWAWYQRGGETVFPKRKIVEREAFASNGDRAKSRFRDEATRESSGNDSSSMSTRDCETSLFDSSELSSIAERVQQLVQNLEVDVSSENPSLHRASTADIKLNERAFDPSSTSDRSEPPTDQSHQNTFEKENVFDNRRSFSDLAGSRQFHQQTSGKIETHSIGVIRDIAEGTSSCKQRKSSFRGPFSVVQRLFQGTSGRCSNPCSEVNTQAQTLHHHHHHHHVYYHHISDEELQPPGIITKARPPRRNSESFTAYTKGGSPDHEPRRVSRHSVDVSATYKVDYTGDAPAEARDYFYRPATSKVHP